MTLADAAERVLLEHSRGAPLHYRRITEIAINEGLITPRGATPEASLNAAVTQEIKRRDAMGRDQRFKRVGRGRYGLAVPTDPLGGAIKRKNSEVRNGLRRALEDMDPRQFEALVGELLVALGYEDVEVTRYSADGGIDVRGTLAVGGVTQVRTAIQVKRWTKNISGATVQQLRGSLGSHERGLLVTLSDFTEGARREAEKPDRSPISLVNGKQLVDLLVEHEIGVTTRRLAVLELDESAFAPAEAEGAPDPTSMATGPGGVSVAGPIVDKALSVWPLPGGADAWGSSLDEMMRFVADTAPTMRQATEWMITTFERVESERVVRSYWQVLRSFGLIETQGEQIAATAAGAEYLEDPSKERLWATIRANVAGFDEIVERLIDGPQTVEWLLEDLNARLGVSWETDAQVRFRLGWLRILGIAEGSGDEWHLVSDTSSRML